ncbi:MAG: hypothetical protein ACREWG_13490 [Gammaproteobacteria bacterium]
MTEKETSDVPDVDAQLTLTLTPSTILNTLMASAESVHTGWESCVDEAFVVSEYTVVNERNGDHCRFIEQEYADREDAEDSWHDWAVELRVGPVYVTGHWRTRVPGSPADWEWCAGEGERVFINTCALLGKRVRRGWVAEQVPESPRPSRTRH